MYDTLGDSQALETIGKCVSVLSQAVTDNGGTVVKTIGDEVLATFPAAEAAVLASASIMEAVGQAFSDESTRVAVSIGLHFGQVLVEAGDVFGDTVNIASRLVKLANPGQVLTSHSTIEKLPGELKSKTRAIGSFPVKGKREVMNVFEVLLLDAQKDPELTLAPGQGPTMKKVNVYLLLRLGEKEVTLHEDGQSVMMGRDPGHELSVEGKLASRNHAKIECTNGKFVLSDHSTNGTFVLTGEDGIIPLHRETFLLQGTGQISLGQDFEDNPTELVQYYLRQVD
jgi:hypothetical protein